MWASFICDTLFDKNAFTQNFNIKTDLIKTVFI